MPTNQTLILKAQAMGVQIYRCEPAADDPDRFEWRLAAPQADLFDKRGKHVGRHYAGPTWEATDGSRVVAEVTARAKSPDSFAIDWLLLKAKSATGKGRFGTVQYVQRLDTAGGKAPATGCDAGHAGGEVRIGYRAYYYFYSPKP